MARSNLSKRVVAFAVALCFFAQDCFAASLIRDAEIENTLRIYANPIFKAAGVNSAAIKLFIVQDDSINAYVAGGQNMFIHTGLIMATDTPDMLIGVMAHETGHIAGGHLAQGAEKLKNAQLGTILSYVMGAAAAVATRKPEAAAAVITGGNTSIARNYMAYSRSNEQAADQSALNSLDAVNMSAAGLLKTFELLRRNERQRGGNPDPYMLTHPLSVDRIDHVRDHVEKSKIPNGQYPKNYDALHARMVAKLYGFMNSPERTLQKYPMNDRSVAARMARAIAFYKMPDMDRSMSQMSELIRELPNDPFLYELKGQIEFENGRPRDALTDYTKAVSLLPDSSLMLTDLGKVEIAQDLTSQLQPAVAHLEKASLIDNSNPDTWHMLAIAYGKQGNAPMSYLALAEEATLQGDADNAIRQANQAISALPTGSPAAQRAQDVKTHALKMKKEKEENE